MVFIIIYRNKDDKKPIISFEIEDLEKVTPENLKKMIEFGIKFNQRKEEAVKQLKKSGKQEIVVQMKRYKARPTYVKYRQLGRKRIIDDIMLLIKYYYDYKAQAYVDKFNAQIQAEEERQKKERERIKKETGRKRFPKEKPQVGRRVEILEKIDAIRWGNKELIKFIEDGMNYGFEHATAGIRILPRMPSTSKIKLSKRTFYRAVNLLKENGII